MQNLIDAMQYLQSKYNISFTIKDFLGHIYSSPPGNALKKLFYIHDNGYCMYIKKTTEAHQHCVEVSNFRLYQKILNIKNPADGFFGTCWCGVREFVLPLQYHGSVIGALIAGPFPCEPERARSSFERLYKTYGFDMEKLSTKYQNYIESHGNIEAGALTLIRLCAELLNNIFDSYSDFVSYNKIKRQHAILNRAVNYIRISGLCSA